MLITFKFRQAPILHGRHSVTTTINPSALFVIIQYKFRYISSYYNYSTWELDWWEKP